MDSRQESIEFIRNSNQWPRWPILPVVNRPQGKAGLIHAGALTTVRLGNLWDMDQEKWNVAEQIHFESIEALVDAEWEPD